MVITENVIKGKSIHFTGQFTLNPQHRAEGLGATIVPFSFIISLKGEAK